MSNGQCRKGSKDLLKIVRGGHLKLNGHLQKLKGLLVIWIIDSMRLEVEMIYGFEMIIKY